MGLNVSIVGATGNVGREFLEILYERKFPLDELFLLASSKSKGKKLKFGEIAKGFSKNVRVPPRSRHEM